MLDRAAMAEEHDAALRRVLELGLAVAEKAQARLLAAETDEEMAQRMLAFTRAARSVRQTIALRSRLAHETERAERQAASAQAEDRDGQVERRRQKVRLTLKREIWNEHEDDDETAEGLLDHLDQLLGEDVLEDDFLDRPLEPYLAQLRHDLRLAAEEADAPAPEPVTGDWSPPAANTS